jgi:hypothetical protein
LSASSSSSSHPLSPISPSLPPAPLPSSLSLNSIWKGVASPEEEGATSATATRTGGADEVQGRRFHGRQGVASPDGAVQPWPGTAWGPTPQRTGLPYLGGSPSPWAGGRTGGRRRPRGPRAAVVAG